MILGSGIDIIKVVRIAALAVREMPPLAGSWSLT